MMKILPIIFRKAGNMDRALEIVEERFKLLKKIVDDKHISLLESQDDLSELCFYKNDTVRLYNTIIEEDKTLLELTEQIPEDNSGSTASNRFGYQKNWPIYKLLELEILLCVTFTKVIKKQFLQGFPIEVFPCNHL